VLTSRVLIRWISAALVVGAAVSPVTAWAQKPEFEVASVKLVKQPVAPHGVSLLINHGTLTMEAAQLRQIIGLAYGVQRVLVFGCPDWCDQDMFDIVAKSGIADATRDQIRERLQRLLEDRFQLATHRETKEVPGYELVVGKKGSLLAEAKDDPGPANVFTYRGNALDFHNMNLVGLVNYLANVLGQPVRDMTGLTGRYNFTLELKAPDPGAGAVATPVDIPGIVFASIDEQLGLKLQARRTPTDVLIVDRAQHPSEN
jgi:uncharacterized protein (TIGR03435 family)